MIGRMAAARGLDPAGTGVVALPLFSQFLKFFNFDLHEQVATAFLKRQLLHRAPRACLPARLHALITHAADGGSRSSRRWRAGLAARMGSGCWS
jgi:hypothetical protein